MIPETQKQYCYCNREHIPSIWSPYSNYLHAIIVSAAGYAGVSPCLCVSVSGDTDPWFSRMGVVVMLWKVILSVFGVSIAVIVSLVCYGVVYCEDVLELPNFLV